jgi:hypothetical protein
MAYGNSGDAVLKSARFFDHYLVLEFDTQQQYLDLLKMEKDANNKDTLALSGWVTNKIADKFTGAGALVDALKHYVYVGDSKPSVADSEAFAEIPKRVSTVLAGKAYNLKGEILTSGLVVVGTSNGLRYHIWPKVILPQSGDAVTTPSPYTSLSGPASVMDGDVSSVDDKFKLEFQTADLRTAKIVGDVKDAEAKDIALYVTEDPNGTDKINRYFVIFRYNSPDPKDVHVFRHRPVELFNKDNPYPGNVQIDGLVKQGAAVASRGAAGYKFVSGSTKEKGVFAMFQNKQVSSENAQNGKANCVGPLVWWGLASRDAALQVCKDGKF